MTGRQVEVIPGNHLVATRAGAIVVVAHRDPVPLTSESIARRTWRMIDDLFTKAIEHDGDQFGRAFGRLAARWAAEQEDGAEFGVLSPVATGLAVFLRGNVIAQIEHSHGPETLRGSDAAAFVDLIRPISNRAALFVGNEAAMPQLPYARGIGSLIDGVALGSGAILWLADGEPARASDEHGYRPQPAASVVEMVNDDSGGYDAISSTPPRKHVVLKPPEVFDLFTEDDDPLPSRPPLPTGPEAPAIAPDPAIPEAETPRGRPRVLGVHCRNEPPHLNDPRASLCHICGRRMDHTQILTEGERPSLGALVLDDGTLLVLNSDYVVGRNPGGVSSLPADDAIPFPLSEPAGRMSRAHAEFRLVEWDVAVVDLDSLNGTFVRSSSSAPWQQLRPRTPFILEPGAEVAIGSRVLTFHSPHARV